MHFFILHSDSSLEISNKTLMFPPCLYVCFGRFITVDDLSGILGNNTDSEALRKVWRDSLLELQVQNVDRITLHEFKSIMKGRPKDGVPGFMQFNPALLASFLIEQMFSKCHVYDQDFFPLLGDATE
jgi:hypothetical protein